LTFKTLNSVLPFILDAKFPVLIRGRHGIGKSAIVYQIAEQRGLPVIERRASQMTEGDLLGLPKVEGNVTKWLAPQWLHDACEKPAILFLDEVDRATMEVRQGIFELCDSRKIAGYTLHPDTLIFACVNGGEHGAQYQVGEFDPAELDRYTCFDVQPTVEDWLEWADGNVVDQVWDFINQNHQHLEHTDEYEPNKVYPSRRSWVRLSDALLAMGGEIKQSPVLYHLASSFIGFEGAVAFNDFVANYKKIVTVENILDEGKLELYQRVQDQRPQRSYREVQAVKVL
jgi:MoxR-like ATPase